ncbi:MAG TPA: carboxypeptidase-like regulatory domain-containing protein, partial [Candidatus Acidoferrales bacterium]|nr:carboxypeptidase-like regulatory domain-containing protein [Candidatus Acidoferrales bacterium]
MITGMVSADQGQVRGFRVTAHNLRNMIWYVVFTKDAKYTVPQALPGPYEISVLQDGYDSPVQKADLAPGETRTVNIALTKQAEKPSDVVYKTFEEMYPPGPGLDLLKKNCIGCHGPDSYNAMHLTEAGYRAGLRKMMHGPFNLGGVVPPMSHTVITKAEQDA